MMKMRYNYDVIDCASDIYAEIETELSSLIGQDANYHENQIGE